VDFGRYVLAAPYLGWLGRGIALTLVISFVSGCGATILGFGVLHLHLARRRLLRVLGAGFVLVFRNLPLVPLLLLLTFGLPGLWAQVCGCRFPRGLELYLLLLGLSLNTGAYLAEILRAGVLGVTPHHRETARTLGLSNTAIRWHVVYPQATRIVAPALATRWIHNMKNSTLALVVPLPVERMEVVGQAGRIAGQTFSWAEPLIVVAGVHLLLSLGLGWLLNRWAGRQQARIQARPS
jgi:polar amino acid transport system permease protein